MSEVAKTAAIIPPAAQPSAAAEAPKTTATSNWRCFNAVLPNKDDSLLMKIIKVVGLVLTAPIACLMDLANRVISIFSAEEAPKEEVKPPVVEPEKKPEPEGRLKRAGNWMANHARKVTGFIKAHPYLSAGVVTAAVATGVGIHYKATISSRVQGFFTQSDEALKEAAKKATERANTCAADLKAANTAAAEATKAAREAATNLKTCTDTLASAGKQPSAPRVPSNP